MACFSVRGLGYGCSGVRAAYQRWAGGISVDDDRGRAVAVPSRVHAVPARDSPPAPAPARHAPVWRRRAPSTSWGRQGRGAPTRRDPTGPGKGWHASETWRPGSMAATPRSPSLCERPLGLVSRLGPVDTGALACTSAVSSISSYGSPAFALVAIRRQWVASFILRLDALGSGQGKGAQWPPGRGRTRWGPRKELRPCRTWLRAG